MTTHTTQSDSRRFSGTGLTQAEGGGVRQGDALLWDNGHRETVLDDLLPPLRQGGRVVQRTLLVQAEKSGRQRLVFYAADE